MKRCGAVGRTHIDVQTTNSEAVDVTAKVTADDATRSVGRCVEEAAWAIELPTDFDRSRLGLHLALRRLTGPARSRWRT